MATIQNVARRGALYWWRKKLSVKLAPRRDHISMRQIDAYASRFGFEKTSTNLDRVKRIIYGARA